MEEKIYYNIGQIITPLADLAYGELHISRNQAVKVGNGKILSIGDSELILSENPGVLGIDCAGKTVLPAFVDPHTHPVFWKTRQEEFRMRLEGRDYEEIAAAGGGIRNSVRSFRKASYEELLEVTLGRMYTFCEYGTLTIEAKSGYGLSTEDEIKALKIIKEAQQELPLTIISTFLGAHEIPDEYRNDPDAYVELVIRDMIPKVAEQKLAKFCDIFCEKDVFTVDQSEKILLAAKDHGLIPKLHADELNPFGGAELAAKVKAISADHLIEISDRGIEEMREAGVIPVLLPATTFFLRKDKFAPARKMIDSGLPVAISTDFNPGSSMTQNMHMAQTVAALKMGMLPNEILWASTLQAAKAIAIDSEVGSMEIGKAADFLLMDIPDIDYLPYHFGVSHILMVIKKGEVIVPGLEKD